MEKLLLVSEAPKEKGIAPSTVEDFVSKYINGQRFLSFPIIFKEQKFEHSSMEYTEVETLSQHISKLSMIEVKNQHFLMRLNLQPDGGYVAEVSTPIFGAIGQGETEEQAIQDIRDAIDILIEETSNSE